MKNLNSNRTTIWSSFGSVGAALGVAACCVGPVVAVSLGATGAWIGQLSALEPYRPLFMAVAVGCLGWAFWREYGSRGRGDAECDEDCEVSSTSRLNRVVLWTATVLVAVSFASPYLLEWSATDAAANERVASETAKARAGAASGRQNQSKPSIQRIELNIGGMTCQGCVKTVRSTLSDVEGVESVEVTLEPPRASVEVRRDEVSPEKLVAAIENVGYSAEVRE